VEALALGAMHLKRSKGHRSQIGVHLRNLYFVIFNCPTFVFSTSGLALDELINQSFTGVFMHRYKDTRAVLREESMASLGQWIGVYPERLFDAHYLK